MRGGQSANHSVSQASSRSNSQSGKQVGRQTKTPSFGFFSVAGLVSCSGEDTFCHKKPQWNGNLAACRHVSRWFESCSVESRLCQKNPATGNRNADLCIRGNLRYRSTGTRSSGHCSPYCLKPSDQKPLTSTPPPTPLPHPK